MTYEYDVKFIHMKKMTQSCSQKIAVAIIVHDWNNSKI